METATIGAINKGFKFKEAYQLYVVADVSHAGERCIFYVGQTRGGVAKRLCAHVNSPTRLGWLIRANWPQSLGWKVQAYRPEEVIPTGTRDKSMLLNQAEQKLIAYFRPPLNVHHNDKPHPLPTRYRLVKCGHFLPDKDISYYL